MKTNHFSSGLVLAGTLVFVLVLGGCGGDIDLNPTEQKALLEQCRGDFEECLMACEQENGDVQDCLQICEAEHEGCVDQEEPVPPDPQEDINCEEFLNTCLQICEDEGSLCAAVCEDLYVLCNDEEPPPPPPQECEELFRQCLENCQCPEGCDQENPEGDDCMAMCEREYEECLNGIEPPPPPPQECEELFRQCLENCQCPEGCDRENPEGDDCMAMCEREYEECLNGIEPPPPPPQECEELFHQCLENCQCPEGCDRENPEGDDCMAMCEREYEECLNGIEPPPPPPQECEELFHQCLENCQCPEGCDRENPEGDDCMAMCEREYEECLNGIEPPPPPPEECEVMFQECLERCGQEPNQGDDDCWRWCEEEYQACIGQVEPPPEECEVMFQECLERCGQEPDQGDDECWRWCEEEYQACMGQVEPPPEPNECEIIFEECIRECGDGQDPDQDPECLHRCEELYVECEGQVEPPHPCDAIFEQCIMECGEQNEDCMEFCEALARECLGS